jgi:hypothetical protein
MIIENQSPELMGFDWGKAFRGVVNLVPGGKTLTSAYMSVKKPMPRAVPAVPAGAPAPSASAPGGTSDKIMGIDKKYVMIGGAVVGGVVLLSLLKR